MSIEEDVVTRAGPATKRGQYLLSADLLNLLSGPWTPFRQEQFGLTILAIEQEAAAIERKKFRAAIIAVAEHERFDLQYSSEVVRMADAILEEGES